MYAVFETLYTSLEGIHKKKKSREAKINAFIKYTTKLLKRDFEEAVRSTYTFTDL